MNGSEGAALRATTREAGRLLAQTLTRTGETRMERGRQRQRDTRIQREGWKEETREINRNKPKIKKNIKRAEKPRDEDAAPLTDRNGKLY